MKKPIKSGLLILAIFGLFGIAQAQPPVYGGLPIKIGDTVETVKQAYSTQLDPEPFLFNGQAVGTQINLKSKGVWVVFDRRDRVQIICLSAPFSGKIAGVGIYDPKEQLVRLLGPPVKKTKNEQFLVSYIYYFDDVTTTIYGFNRYDNVETICLSK